MARRGEVRTAHVQAYGRLLRIDLDGADPAPLLADALPPPFRVMETTFPAAPSDRTWTARDTDELVTSVLPALELWVAEWARDRVFVHAGCVAVDGRAILLPGRSHTGKTTLTAALLRAGAEYLSDEYAVLDGDGLVYPYPRRLRVRSSGEWMRLAADELGARTVEGPRCVGLVARLRYDPAGPGWEALSPARGVLEVLDNTVCAQRRPHEAMDAVSAALAGVMVVAGTRGEADETAHALVELMRR
jgi:hypothetical protein